VLNRRSARVRSDRPKRTKRRRRLQRLLQEETQFRAIFESAAFGIVLADAEGRPLDCNPTLERMLGYTTDEFRTMRISDFIHPDDAEETEHALQALAEGELEHIRTEQRYIRKDGSLVWVNVIASTVLNTNGERGLSIAMIEDIGARKSAEADTVAAVSARESAEADTAASREYAADLIETAGAIVVGVDADGDVLVFNKAAEEITGYAREEILGRNWFELVAPRERYPRVWEEFERLRVGGRPKTTESPILSKSGEERFIVWRNTHYRTGGQNAGTVSIGIEVTERKRAEAALHRERDLMSRVMETSPIGIVALNRTGDFIFANTSAAKALGLSRSAATGLKFEDASWRISGYDGAPFPESDLPFQRVMATRKRVRNVRFAIERPDGQRVLLSVNAAPIFSDDGEIDGLVEAIEDITGREHAEEERARLQSELVQAQKMEVVGRLAGGVAHSFNNLLTAISGYNELLLANLPEGSDLRAYSEEVKRGATRAAEVTRELLHFSRHEPGRRESFDLSQFVSEMEPLLRQLIRSDVEIVTELCANPGRIESDRSHLEQAIINLVINACDAMPDGGKLFIETANLDLTEPLKKIDVTIAPGRYVSLVVRDTGTGIDEAIRARIFEPFFTTKSPEHGTGLGLSMVFALVDGSGGHIFVDSRVNEGTTFEIFLPAVAS
jgi:two-component system cell cycle sensor histidine kinase/response regulator CckA